MRRIFVDTLYWIAITNRRDQWHQAAVNVSRALAGCHLVTTDAVLTEVLNGFSEAGSVFRREAVTLARDLQADPTVTKSSARKPPPSAFRRGEEGPTPP